MSVVIASSSWQRLCQSFLSKHTHTVKPCMFLAFSQCVLGEGGVTAHLPAFLVVGEVAVSREPSCTELLPGVGVLIGLGKILRTKINIINNFSSTYDFIVRDVSTSATDLKTTRSSMCILSLDIEPLVVICNHTALPRVTSLLSTEYCTY